MTYEKLLYLAENWSKEKASRLTCHRCEGTRTLIGAITQPSVIAANLDALELPSQPPHIAPARAPPEQIDLFD